MASRYLTREDAPIDPKTWEIMDNTMIAVARGMLTGRRLLHVDGPYGLGLKGIPLGDPKMGEGPLTTGFIPLSFIHRTFTLSKRDLAAYERDQIALDLAELVSATIACVRMEDRLIFSGDPTMPGLLIVTGFKVLPSAWDEVGAAAEDVIKMVNVLDNAGFAGPYAIALPPARYNQLLRLYPAGYTSELDHMKTIAADGVFKAPGMEADGMLIAAGKQLASIVLGQDLTIGFVGPVGERLEFSVSESLALLVREPKAICVLGG